MTFAQMREKHRDIYQASPEVLHKPTILIYASCHGRTLYDYLTGREDFMAKFNLTRLETGPMTQFIQEGIDVFKVKEIERAMLSADGVITNNMGARNAHHALDRIRPMFSNAMKIITFTAPNFSAFWPFAYGYTGCIGLLDMFDKGVSQEAGWQAFVNGDFDPLFNLRWRLEMGRLDDRDQYHDIKLAEFVARAHKKVKLFMSSSHPTFIPMAYVGAELCSLLGLPGESFESLLQHDYKRGAIGGQPETEYEFKHYDFEYPMRHHNDAGGYYRTVYDYIYGEWKKRSGFLISPPVD